MPCSATDPRRTRQAHLRGAWVTAAVIAVTALIGCGSERTPATEMATYRAAVRLQEQGSFDEALEGYRGLRAGTRDRRMRAKVDLAIAQIEMATARRDRAIRALEALPDQVAERPLAAIEAEIRGRVAEFDGTAFHSVMADREVVTLQDARRRWTELRNRDMQAADNLIERGEFAAALVYLRELEAHRPAGDREDIAVRLESVARGSAAAADRLLGETTPARPPGQISTIEEAMPRFRGTDAYARLLEAKLDAAGDALAAPATSGGTAVRDHDQP